MIPRHFRGASYLCLIGCAALAAQAPAETLTGVVSDSLNGLLLDSVTVSAGGVSAITDAKGAFTLELSPSSVYGPGIRQAPQVKWDAASGTLSWDGYSGSLAISVYSLRGDRVAYAAYASADAQAATRFSLARLPQGIYKVAADAQGIRTVFTISSLGASQSRGFALLSQARRSLAKAAATTRPYELTVTRNNYDAATVTVPAGSEGGLALKLKSPYPLRNVLRLFTQPGIPETGPEESPASPRNWTAPAKLPDLIGEGPAQHDMLYVGENYRRIGLIIGGKLAWHYDTKNSWELDDIWMLSNGNILYSHMTYIEEITPQKKVVWHYDNPAGSEIHTCQPIGLDKVLFMQNQQPASRIRLYNKVTKAFEIDQEVPSYGGATHGQCRRLRMTSRGTYIASTLSGHSVSELDKDFKVMWTYKSAGSVWSAAALKNGNVLIQDEGMGASIEVNKSGVVWKWSKSEIALPAGTQMGNTQTCERLSSGNTVMFGNGSLNPKNIQAVEATPAKQVVWMLQDWIDLGDATSGQFLDEPGYPEIPGQTNH